MASREQLQLLTGSSLAQNTPEAPELRALQEAQLATSSTSSFLLR